MSLNVGFIQNTLYADNADFSNSGLPASAAGLQTDGDLWIGNTALNAGGTHIHVGKITGAGGVTVTNVAGNIQINGTGAGTDLHTALYIVSSAGVGTGTGANYTTIAAAIAAAVGTGINSTIFIMPGSTGVYTENFTLPAGIDLAAFDCEALTPNVTISGKITCTTAGSRTISGIRLQTNSDFFLAVTGSAATVVNLRNCYLNCLNNTGISFTSANTSAFIQCTGCRGNMGTTGIALYASSSTGQIRFDYCYMNNAGASTTISSNSAGNSNLFFCDFSIPVGSSSTGQIGVQNSIIDVQNVGVNAICITANGSAVGTAYFSYLSSGSSSALTVGAGETFELFNCSINSSNTNAVTGAGTLIIGDNTFLSSQIVNTTTQSMYVTQKGARKVTLPAGDYTVLATDEIVGATSSGARAITLNASPTKGQFLTVKDITGTANTHNITITPAAGNIDGSGTYVINANYGSVDLWYSGVQWFVS